MYSLVDCTHLLTVLACWLYSLVDCTRLLTMLTVFSVSLYNLFNVIWFECVHCMNSQCRCDVPLHGCIIVVSISDAVCVVRERCGSVCCRPTCPMTPTGHCGRCHCVLVLTLSSTTQRARCVLPCHVHNCSYICHAVWNWVYTCVGKQGLHMCRETGSTHV